MENEILENLYLSYLSFMKFIEQEPVSFNEWLEWRNTKKDSN